MLMMAGLYESQHDDCATHFTRMHGWIKILLEKKPACGGTQHRADCDCGTEQRMFKNPSCERACRQRFSHFLQTCSAA